MVVPTASSQVQNSARLGGRHSVDGGCVTKEIANYPNRSLSPKVTYCDSVIVQLPQCIL
jgi:hypothetical protein